MAQASRLGLVLLLALTPSACTVLDGVDGLTGGSTDDAGGDVVETDANEDSPDVGTMDTSMPPAESGADAPRDVGGETPAEGSTVDAAQDGTSPPDVQEAPALAYFQVVAMDGPKAYWRLDEPVGATTAKDATGNGYDGTYVGGVALGAAGAIANDADTAASFDGTTGYVDVGTAFPFAGMTAFTLEAWVKPMLDSNYHCWLSHNDAASGPTEGYLAYTDPAGTYYSFQRVDMSVKITAANNTIATNDTWTYVVVTYQPGVGSIVYVNAQAGPTTAGDVSIGSVTSHFVIGAEFGGATSWWTGPIDEVAVYDYVLPAARITAHYNVGTGQ